MRGFLIGCLFVAGIALLEPYLLMLVQSQGGFCADFMVAGAILGLFILVVFSILFSFINRKLSLSPPELLLAYMMMAIGCTIPSWGLMGNLIPVLGGIRYFATSQNRWLEIVVSRIKPYLIPQNQQAITYFYEGLPKNTPIPYLLWVKPFLVWFGFILVFSFLSICVAVIFRKQWVENERLRFPLTILPIEMVRKEKDSKIPALFKNKLMWFGFAIPFLITALQGLHYYFPLAPQITLWQGFPIFQGGGAMLVLFFTVLWLTRKQVKSNFYWKKISFVRYPYRF